MSNFDMLNLGVINATLRTFQTEGLAGLTPIKFEALTPDEFCLLFRGDLADLEMFFVLYQTDYAVSIKQLAGNIADWSKLQPEQFVPPAEAEKVTADTFAAANIAPPDINGLMGVVTRTGDYFNALAIVPRPPATTYWGNVRRIRPGNDATKVLQHIPQPVRITLVQQIMQLAARQTSDLSEQQRLNQLSKTYDGNVPCILPPGAIFGVTYEPASGQTDIVYDVVKS